MQFFCCSHSFTLFRLSSYTFFINSVSGVAEAVIHSLIYGTHDLYIASKSISLPSILICSFIQSTNAYSKFVETMDTIMPGVKTIHVSPWYSLQNPKTTYRTVKKIILSLSLSRSLKICRYLTLLSLAYVNNICIVPIYTIFFSLDYFRYLTLGIVREAVIILFHLENSHNEKL